MLTGTHLLRTGTLETDLGRLASPYGFPAAVDLIAAKRAGERVALAPDARDQWMVEVERSFGLLDEARERSPLPDQPANRPALESWLIALRGRMFQ